MNPGFRGKSVYALGVLLCAIGSSWAAPAAPDSNKAWDGDAEMDVDGCTFMVAVPGVTLFRAGFSAVVEVNGRIRELSSTKGAKEASPVFTTEETPYGLAEVFETEIHFDSEQIDLIFRLGQVPGLPGVLAQAGIRNAGSSPVRLISLNPVAMDDSGQAGGIGHEECGLEVTSNPADWLITGLHDSMAKVIALNEIDKPLVIHEAGGFFRKNGSGFLLGPIGKPVAYVDTKYSPLSDGKTLVNVSVDMSGVRVDPDETRWGQQVILLMEPPRRALARWAEWVGKTHGARTRKDALSGWNNWNGLKKKDVGKELLDVADAVRKSNGHLRPDVIQIDGDEMDGQQVLLSPWIPECAKSIGEVGARYGVRLKFPRRETSLEAGPSDEIIKTVRSAVQKGFTYLKIRYGVTSQIPAGGKRTAFEVYRDDWAAIRKAAGEDTYLLSCSLSPNRAVIGSVDSCRIGSEAARERVRYAIGWVLCSYQLNGRWFTMDNDTYYIGTQVANISEISGSWPLVRTWMSMVGLSCGTAITSDPWYWDSFKPYWGNVEVMTPPAGERTEVLDLCTAREWPRLVGHVRREWGDYTVALLWNPQETEQAVTLDFAGAGMDPARRYAVWSFWDNRFLGVTKGSWTTPALGPSASQHLCFTDLDRTPNKPVLIGSSLHIYCGASEIKNVTSLQGAMEIELTDAGARSGDLFIYSRLQPVLRGETGCLVKDISQAGENVWRISIANRKHGVPQRVDMDILLPVTRQAWFWLMIAGMGASLVFAAWRYLVGLRLERAHALEQERARIAKDLHDEIGANLTHISILSTLAAKPTTGEDVSRRHNFEVASVARQTILAFDEILWSVNPKNDTFSSLSHFICRRTEEILAPANVTYQFKLDESFPEKPVSPHRRHGLLLAVKEALHNILKHAGASRVDLQCTVEAGTFVVRLSDNGRGFAPQAVPDGAHGRVGQGLENMRRRMIELGGECVIESTPGQGTRIVFRLPLE